MTRHRVTTFHWNPRAPLTTGPLGRHIPVRRRINNFGDLLGPMVVEGMRKHFGIDSRPAARSAQLLTVGSVLHFAQPGAVIWGSGVNGHWLSSSRYPARLDVRAVRGPRTREFLRGLNIPAPPVYGDPALLLPLVRPDLRHRPRRGVTVVRNLNDIARAPEIELPPYVREIDPRAPLESCLEALVSSELVVASSLHAIIVAEAFGIPARLLAPAAEPLFKYQDYFEGVGRRDVPRAESVEQALKEGGAPPIDWDPKPLMQAFPVDLWH